MNIIDTTYPRAKGGINELIYRDPEASSQQTLHAKLHPKLLESNRRQNPTVRQNDFVSLQERHNVSDPCNVDRILVIINFIPLDKFCYIARLSKPSLIFGDLMGTHERKAHKPYQAHSAQPGPVHL